MKLDSDLGDLQSVQSLESSSSSSYQHSTASDQSARPKQTKIMKLYQNSSLTNSIATNDEIEIVPKLDSAQVDIDLHLGYCLHSKTLGEGIFGKVRLATHLRTFQNVAVKIVNKKRFRNEQDRLTIDTEIKASKELRHCNIARLLQLIETDEHIYIIREYCPNGDLYDYVDSRDKLDPEETRKIMIDLVNCLDYIHDRGFAHRDIRPENILLDSRGRIKLVGFQFAYMRFGRLSYDQKDFASTKTQYLSPEYVAPEVLNGGHKLPAPAIDVWGSGILLHFMLTGTLPFTDDSLARLFKKIESGIFAKPNSLSTDIIDLLERMLTVDPSKRITIKEIINHRWIKNLNPQATSTTLSSYYVGNSINVWSDNDKLDDNILELCHQLHRDDVEDLIELRYNIRYKFGYQTATYWLVKAADYDDPSPHNVIDLADVKLNGNLKAITSSHSNNNNNNNINNGGDDNLAKNSSVLWRPSHIIQPKVVSNQIRRRHTIIESSRASPLSTSWIKNQRKSARIDNNNNNSNGASSDINLDHSSFNKQIVKQRQMLQGNNGKKFDKSIIILKGENKPSDSSDPTVAHQLCGCVQCSVKQEEGEEEEASSTRRKTITNFKPFNLSKILLFSNKSGSSKQQKGVTRSNQLNSFQRSISDHNLSRNNKPHVKFGSSICTKRSKPNMNSVNDQQHTAGGFANDSLVNVEDAIREEEEEEAENEENEKVAVATKSKKCSLKKSLSRRLSIALPNKFRVGAASSNRHNFHINSGSVIASANANARNGQEHQQRQRQSQQSTSSGIDSVSTFSSSSLAEQNDQLDGSYSLLPVADKKRTTINCYDNDNNIYDYDNANCRNIESNTESDFTSDDEKEVSLSSDNNANNKRAITLTTANTKQTKTKPLSANGQRMYSSKKNGSTDDHNLSSASSMEIYPPSTSSSSCCNQSLHSSVELSNTGNNHYAGPRFRCSAVAENQKSDSDNKEKKNENKNKTNRNETTTTKFASTSQNGFSGKSCCSCGTNTPTSRKSCSFSGSSSVAIITRYNNREECMNVTEELLTQKGINCTRHKLHKIRCSISAMNVVIVAFKLEFISNPTLNRGFFVSIKVKKLRGNLPDFHVICSHLTRHFEKKFLSDSTNRKE